MRAIHAIYENGVFRPEEAVNLAPGTRVVVETEEVAAERKRAARRRVFETLSRSYDTDADGDNLATHNDHRP
jgi:predicted DNA-binding antitoxin AbrB/MazE fold protein